MSTDSKWLTLDEVCDHLQLGRTKVYGLAQQGQLPACKLGGQWRFDVAEVDEWTRQQRESTSTSKQYVHVYSEKESTRLLDQAQTQQRRGAGHGNA